MLLLGFGKDVLKKIFLGIAMFRILSCWFVFGSVLVLFGRVGFVWLYLVFLGCALCLVLLCFVVLCLALLVVFCLVLSCCVWFCLVCWVFVFF